MALVLSALFYVSGAAVGKIYCTEKTNTHKFLNFSVIKNIMLSIIIKTGFYNRKFNLIGESLT